MIMDTMILPNNCTDLIKAMRNCYQTSNLDMLQHGIHVNKTYHILRNIITNKITTPTGWRIPEWCWDSLLLNGQMDMSLISTYMIFHDCGKPYVKNIDENNKIHYPDHALMSSKIWMHCNKDNDINKEISTLMKMDMDIYLLKSSDIPEFASRKQALTLLLVGLAEVHANAEMFGGFESTSFKIKIKHISKKGKQIIQYIKEKTND